MADPLFAMQGAKMTKTELALQTSLRLVKLPQGSKLLVDSFFAAA